MHGLVGAPLAEHLVAHRDVAEVSKRGLALRADKAFRAGWPTWKRCFNFFSSDISSSWNCRTQAAPLIWRKTPMIGLVHRKQTCRFVFDIHCFFLKELVEIAMKDVRGTLR